MPIEVMNTSRDEYERGRADQEVSYCGLGFIGDASAPA
jgi:hypothetical protein